MRRRPSPIRAVLQQARRELTVLEQIGEFVVLPLCICAMFGLLTIAAVL